MANLSLDVGARVQFDSEMEVIRLEGRKTTRVTSTPPQTGVLVGIRVCFDGLIHVDSGEDYWHSYFEYKFTNHYALVAVGLRKRFKMVPLTSLIVINQ